MFVQGVVCTHMHMWILTLRASLVAGCGGGTGSEAVRHSPDSDDTNSSVLLHTNTQTMKR